MCSWEEAEENHALYLKDIYVPRMYIIILFFFVGLTTLSVVETT